MLLPFCALLGLLSVAPVLAWVHGLGSFEAWFWSTTVPAMGALVAVGLVVARRPDQRRLRTALITGTVGGLLGTVGYDAFRVPFAAAGLRVFAPIESYGVLLLGADSSSQWTSFAGWAYHFSNGIGFGVAYAAVALGRRWWWGVLWAMVLETVTIVTPFAAMYGLRGKVGLIGIAYAAHVAYGYPLGVVVERAEDSRRRLEGRSRRATSALLAGLTLALLGWHRPFLEPAPEREGRAVAPGPSALVRGGRFRPEWLRVGVGECAVFRNSDRTTYSISGPGTPSTLAAGSDTRVCFAESGVFRLRASDEAYSGGFVIVDEH
jgi:hypothetical protein